MGIARGHAYNLLMKDLPLERKYGLMMSQAEYTECGCAICLFPSTKVQQKAVHIDHGNF